MLQSVLDVAICVVSEEGRMAHAFGPCKWGTGVVCVGGGGG